MHTQQTEDRTYNGWTNYETWAVNLWIGNEEGSYRFWQERAAYWKAQPSTSEVWTPAESTKYNLAEELKTEVEDNQPAAIQGTLYADLLQGALSEVNWTEIAAGLLED